jgi:glycosyltransferase involved in cell wall biosynthesis
MNELNNGLMLSVNMITYQHELYIKQAVEGVLMQETNFEFQLIVCDDCSPDTTQQIVQNLIDNHPKGYRIKYFRHNKNIGMQPNGIFALNNCIGKYIALCEGDDYWTDPLKLQKQVDFLEANPDYVLCFHQVGILKTDGEIVDDFITKVPENYENIETLARLGNYIHTPSVVFRNVIKEFPFEFELSPIGDYFLYIMLAKYGKLKYLEDKMAIYRYGVGVHSSLDNLNFRLKNNQIYSCLLSYLVDENLKKIILERKFIALDGFNRATQYEYTLNKYLSSKKTYADILKVVIMKMMNTIKLIYR